MSLFSWRKTGSPSHPFAHNKPTYMKEEHHQLREVGWTSSLALCIVGLPGCGSQAPKRNLTTANQRASPLKDIDAQNVNGETDLHDAIRESNSHEVIRLLKEGADVDITDRFGNTPLHFWTGHLDSRLCTTIIEGMRDPRQLNIFGRMSPLYWRQEKFQDYMGNTALHLVCERYLIDGLQAGKTVREFVLMNATGSDFEVRNCFGETAHLSVFLAYLRGDISGLPECMKNSIETTDDCGRTILHRICMDSNVVWTKHKLECVEDLAHKKDMHGRIPLHYAAMRRNCLCADHLRKRSVMECYECMKLLDDSRRKLSSVTDIYGRTPWHYACMNTHYFDPASLFTREKRKSVRIVPFRYDIGELPDIDGITPSQMSDMKHEIFDDYFLSTGWKKKKRQFRVTSLDTSLHRKFTETRLRDYGRQYQDLIPVREMWEGELGKYYADRNELTPHVNNAVVAFMERLAAAIRREDERLQCDVLQIGSSFEGTKVDLPDEFDFNVSLTRFGDICEVAEPTQKRPPGFEVLQRRQGNMSPNNECSEFFNDDNSLNVRKLNSVFQCAVKKVLSSREFCSNEALLETVCDGNFPDVHPSRFCMPLILRFKRAINGKPILFEMKLDIAPVIHIAGWWHADAISVNELAVDRQTKAQLLSEGCHFVFDQPYRKYRVQYSDTQYVKISFARAESILLRNGWQVMRDALMLAKHTCTFAKHLNFSTKSMSTWSHALKTAALYYAFETQKHLHLRELVEELFLQLYRFTQQDFVPSFFLPTLHTKVWDIETYVHYSHEVLRERHKTYMELFERGIQEADEDAGLLMEIRDSQLYGYFIYRGVCRKDTDCVKWEYPKL